MTRDTTYRCACCSTSKRIDSDQVRVRLWCDFCHHEALFYDHDQLKR